MCQHSLKVLNLSRNRLVSTKGIAYCAAIKDLNLSGNQICDEELSISISGIKRLRRLDVSLNCLKSGGILSNTVTTLRGLKTLRAG
jgi:Leucine-rich repeat (LRR) protein